MLKEPDCGTLVSQTLPSSAAPARPPVRESAWGRASARARAGRRVGGGPAGPREAEKGGRAPHLCNPKAGISPRRRLRLLKGLGEERAPPPPIRGPPEPSRLPRLSPLQPPAAQGRREVSAGALGQKGAFSVPAGLLEGKGKAPKRRAQRAAPAASSRLLLLTSPIPPQPCPARFTADSRQRKCFVWGRERGELKSWKGSCAGGVWM